MKPKEIQVGKTYVSRKTEKRKRTVTAIGKEYISQSYSAFFHEPYGRPGVVYEQNGKQSVIYLDCFAKWAGREA